MIKDKQTELLDDCGVRLTITVEKDAIKKEYDALVQEYCGKVRLDGFRKGKVPADILVRKYRDLLIGETAEKVLQKSLTKALEEVEQKPIATSLPRIDMEGSLELGKDLTYKVTYDTYPKIELAQYKGLAYEELQVEIGEEDIERELKTLQEQNSIVVDKQIPVVAKGDIVNVDFVELEEGGKAREKTRRQSFVFEVGSFYNLYGIDEDILGLKAGEEKILAKEYPADFAFKELAGRRVTLQVRVNAVKEKQLPEINDELAQDISEKYKGLDDLRKDIRERLEKYKAQKLREHSISQILEKVADGSTIVLPKSMVEHQLEEEWRHFLGRLRADEADIVQQLEKQGRSKETVLAEWRPRVERKLRLQLSVNEMGRRENVQVSDAEFDGRMQQDAEAHNISLEEARELYSKNDLGELVRFDLRNEKLYDLLLAGAVRKKGKRVKFLDLLQGNY